MFKKTLAILITLTAIAVSAQKTYKYPDAPKDSITNTYFDTIIADPYQWMEDPTDPRLADWLKAQKRFTNGQSHKQVQKWTLRAQIASMYSNTRKKNAHSYVKKEYKGKYQFKYSYKEFNRSPDLLYKKKGETNFKYLVRAKNFRKSKKDNIIITGRYTNPEENKIAIEISHSGSDWREVYFFDLESGAQLQDTLKYLRTGSNIIWHKNGVYYDRFKKPKKGRELLDKSKGQALYYHQLGASQSTDQMLYQNPDTTGTHRFIYDKVDSSRLFFYHHYNSRGKIYNAISHALIDNTNSFFLKNFVLYPKNDSVNFHIESVIGTHAIINTTLDAPNGRLLKADITQLNKLEAFVPQYDIPLQSVNRLGKDKIGCIYRNNGQFLALIFSLDGELLKRIEFPEGKKVNYFYENDTAAEYTDFCVSSFYHPNLWYQLSLKDLTYKPSRTIWVPYDAKELETRYVKYNSKDGTEIPMYITCLKDTKLDGNNPVLLYGYGGYGLTVTPTYNESTTLWLLHGGILATPNIRGGGAEGSEWAKSGRRLNKQNTIDDFIAAAEYLIQEQYTKPDKLAIKGGSHGGFLVGATLTQRPDLFKAAIAEAGVFDLMRFEKFTIGSSSTSIDEFGEVSNYEDFRNLLSLSPMHNVKSGIKYPNVLLISGDNDDRVPVLHSYKFLATLQEKGSPKSIYQLYLVLGAGHKGALTPDDWIDKMLFEYYFLFDQLDLRFY